MRSIVTARCMAALSAGFGIASFAAAQDAPFNASLVSRFDQAGNSYADIWAEGDYAYLPHYQQPFVDIVNISNPAAPFFVARYTTGSPDANTSSQEVAVKDGILYLGNEASTSSPTNGVHIVDVRDASSPARLTTMDPEPGTYEAIHNLFLDNGWLFLANSRDNTWIVADLRTYNPDSPPASINTYAYQSTNVGGIFVHDIDVTSGVLCASAWDSMRLYDVDSLATTAPIFLGSVPGYNTHSAIISPDGLWSVAIEEREGGAARLYETVRVGNSVTLIPRDSFALPLSKTYDIHDGFFVDNRIYLACYQAGGQVLELDRTSKTLELVASYDTSADAPVTFSAAWGVYPFDGADRVLVSDIQNGMHIVDFSAVEITWPSARPETIQPGVEQAISVELNELGNSVLVAASVTLYASVNDAAFQPIAMTNTGGNDWTANLPAMGCGGKVEYYVSAGDTLGRTAMDPATAPTNTHVAWVAESLTTIFSDDFDTSLGWTISNTSVTDGAFVRANPAGTQGQPEDDDPDATGSFCYITGSAGGSISDDDLDGGPSRITSPTINLSGGDALIRYARWFFNDDGDSDNLTVEISNNGGSSWVTVETVANKAGGWVHEIFRVSDYVAPSSTTVVRFSASDQPNSSVTEAGVDSFRVQMLDCTSQAAAVERNGSGVNPSVYHSVNLPRIGTVWTATVDTTGHPGTTFSYQLGFDAPLAGLATAFGELLVDPAAQNLTLNLAFPIFGIATHNNSIPNDAGLIGFLSYTQAAIFGSGPELTNAIDLTLDY